MSKFARGTEGRAVASIPHICHPLCMLTAYQGERYFSLGGMRVSEQRKGVEKEHAMFNDYGRTSLVDAGLRGMEGIRL